MDAARTVARPDEAGTVARERFDEGGGLVGSGRPPCVALALTSPVGCRLTLMSNEMRHVFFYS